MKRNLFIVLTFWVLILFVPIFQIKLATGQSSMEEFGVFLGPIQQHTGFFHDDYGVFIPWNTLCKAGQTYLLQSCNALINPHGSLTGLGQTAVGCITNGAIITALAAKLNLKMEFIKGILGALARPTGCSGIVDLNSISNSPDINRLADMAASRAGAPSDSQPITVGRSMQEFGVFLGPIQQHTGVYHDNYGVFIPWNTLCKAGQTYLLQSCNALINPDGSLTNSGHTAVACITNGGIITLLAAKFNMQIESIKGVLDALVKPLGCSGIVDLNSIPNSPDIQRLVDIAAATAVPANFAVGPSESQSFSGNKSGNMSGSMPSESQSFSGNMSGNLPWWQNMSFVGNMSVSQNIAPSGGNSKVSFHADLVGEAEVPPLFSESYGSAVVFGNDRSLSYRINVSSLDKATAAYLYAGDPTVNGQIIVSLFNSTKPTGVVNGELAEGNISESNIIIPTGNLTWTSVRNATGYTTLPVSQSSSKLTSLIDLMNQNMTYINIHTTKFPEGELRGTLTANMVYPDLAK